jgi:hypothetical protein
MQGPYGYTVWLREPKIVEKIAHSRGLMEVKLEFKYQNIQAILRQKVHLSRNRWSTL